MKRMSEGDSGPRPADAREARLKAALRANLHRRKAQDRLRRDQDAAGDEGAAAGQGEPAGSEPGAGEPDPGASAPDGSAFRADLPAEEGGGQDTGSGARNGQ